MTKNPYFRVASLSFALVLLIACEATEREAVAPPETPETTETHNALTAEEADAGWELLFDGQSLDHWRGYRTDEVPSKWAVENGVIHFDPDRVGEQGDVISREVYGDFELSVDWRISECGNSGLFYRILESDEYANTYYTGPEYQLLDDHCPGSTPRPDRGTASNYELNAPTVDATKPAGEWNESRIVVTDGANVEHWLNGQKVVEYELWSDDWRSRVDTTKFNQWADYGMAREGHIGLQDHGDHVWFRNIKVRRL